MNVVKNIKRPIYSNLFSKRWKTHEQLKVNKDGDIIIQEVRGKGLITLNRPKHLNCLKLNMINSMYSSLREWQKNKSVFLVIIKGKGEKAFCAGGDMKDVLIGKENKIEIHKDIFGRKYFLDDAIKNSNIPWIAFMDGITMGGGAAISVHGHYRVATERTIFAMPETAIGLIPDVGGGFFLPRLHNHLGTFLALTGHRLKGRDVYHAGIATHFVHSSQLLELESDLLSTSTENHIREVLDEHHAKQPDKRTFSLAREVHWISEIFSSFCLEEIVERLKKAAEKSEFWKNHLQLVLSMSPTAQKVTLAQLERGSKMQTLKEVLEMEYEVVQKIMQGEDFFEGVRALLIDKDFKPQWKPSDPQDVTREIVEAHFEHLPSEQKLRIIHK